MLSVKQLRLIPWDKSWIIRMTFISLVHGEIDHALDWLDANVDTLGDDLVALRRTLRQYLAGEDLDVGESGTLLRFWRFFLWSRGDTRHIITRGTLTSRPIYNRRNVLLMSDGEMLQLDNGTSQWASIALICGNITVPNGALPFHLQMTVDALDAWTPDWQPRKDQTILRQAEAYVEYRRTGMLNFIPEQAEDFCFSVAGKIMSIRKGKKRWSSLKGHESNRPRAMRLALRPWRRKNRSRDHRVVQSLAMFKPHLKFTHPECVAKTWPQFWEFLSTTP